MNWLKPHRKIFRFDPVLGYRFIPNIHLRIMLDRPYTITTNAEGFRGDFSYAKNNGSGLRILALGDSYLAGDGVSNKQRFTNLIENETGWRFLNCGLPGSGTDQQLLIQEKIAQDWDYDVLFFVPFNYNIYRNLRDRMYVKLQCTPEVVEFNKPYFSLRDGGLKLHGFPVSQNRVEPYTPKNGNGEFVNHLAEKYPEIASNPILRRSRRALIDAKNIIKYRYLNIPSDKPFAAKNEYPWQLMKALTERMIKNASGKKVVILPVPQHDHIKYKAYPNYLDRFQEFASEKVKVIDLSPVFKTHSLEGSRELFNRYDNHFSPKAQELVAELLAPELRSFLESEIRPRRNHVSLKREDKYVLGISCYYHDSAAAIIKNGKIVAAVHEERFSRKKHDSSFPLQAVNFCLEEARIDAEELQAVVYYDDPVLSLDRVIANQLVLGEKGEAHWDTRVKSWIQKKFSIYCEVKRKVGYNGELFASLHHRSHAASAFYPSPFKKAAILVVDAVGEWASTSIGVGTNSKIRILKEQHYPHSLGLLYSSFTAYCGFKINSGEYKLMGLAPYGEARYRDQILDEMLRLNDDGSFVLNLEYFSFMQGEAMFSSKFQELLGVPPRKPEAAIDQAYMDIAKSIQEVTEVILFKIVQHTHELTGADYLVMAGGVALNCVANGKLIDGSPFKDIWVQPAAGDAGGALGAALDYYYNTLESPRSLDPTYAQGNSLYGPSYSSSEIEAYLEWHNLPFKKQSDLGKYRFVVDRLKEGKVVGFFTGRMEYGPRALGARSILADPRNREMQSNLNLKIKYRESFRPFAPVVLEEDASEYFEIDRPSPYMLLVRDVVQKRRSPIYAGKRSEGDIFEKVNSARSDIPAVTHVDYSARIQTINMEQNPELYKLLREFKESTGYGILVNTSFNVRGEPIVCTPDDAYRCFMRTEMDVLVMEDYILLKEDQPTFRDDVNWHESYELD